MPKHSTLRSALCFVTTPLLATACAHTGSTTANVSPAVCTVEPGTAIQVSHEVERSGERPAYMFEMQIAQNPNNPNSLVASGIHVRGPDKSDPDQRSQAVLAYVSDDRGKTWRTSPVPVYPSRDGKEPISGDPTVLFSTRGTAIYLALATGPYATRSTDGGRTWEQQTRMIPAGFDHWMPATDFTNGPHSGNLYAWGMRTSNLRPRDPNGPVDYNFIQYEMRLLRSRDDGKTWSDELAAQTTEMGIPGNGLNSVSDLLIDTKGRLYLPFHSWNNLDRSKPARQWLTISDDGGATFTKARENTQANGQLLTGPKAGGYPGYALDNTTGPYRNRLYIVWYDSTSAGRWQLLFSHSDNGGDTFAEPKVLDDSLIKMDQVHPDLQVNQRGNLVVAWYRFRLDGQPTTAAAGTEQMLSYERYVTASVDGGKTFLAKRTFGATSRSLGRLTEGRWGLRYVRFGDYFNIIADPDGSFHTIWMGGDNGPTQQWYAPFRVECR